MSKIEFSIPETRTAIRADVFKLKGKSPADAFVLTLALAYNDLRVTLWMQRILAESKDVRDKDPEGRSEWRGLLIHSQRLQVGILNEVLQALSVADSKGLFQHEFWALAIDEMRHRTPAAYENWKDLVAVARESAGKGCSDLRTFLVKVRSHVAYHYDQPGPLLKGFQTAYPSDNDQINASFGSSALQTRFSFADEAAAKVLYESDVLPGGYNGMSSRIRQVHTALRFFVDFYLDMRRQYLDAMDMSDLDHQYGFAEEPD